MNLSLLYEYSDRINNRETLRLHILTRDNRTKEGGYLTYKWKNGRGSPNLHFSPPKQRLK